MKKVIGLASSLSYFFMASSVFAQNVTLVPPIGSVKDFCITKVPQFIVQLIFIIGVVIAVVFLIYGGIKWILSGGDKTAVETARNHIVSAIVGLIIIAGAFFIIGLIFQLLGQPNPVTNLRINDITGAAITCTP